MSQLFTILNDKIIINKLALRYLEGPVTLENTLEVQGGAQVRDNLVVGGKIVADVIEVNQIINKGVGSSGDGTAFVGDDETQINGQGVTWTVGNEQNALVYKPGGRLYTNLHIDLEAGRSYKIDNIEVLTANTLGSGVVRSSLRQVGPLNNLTVTGNAEVGEFFYVDSDTGRIGLNTESPNGMFGLIDNGVELVIGSKNNGVMNIGTYTSHDVAITTDDTARITVKTGGDVHIGNPTTRGAKLVVHGTIQAENVISETKIERTDSMRFLATDGSIYNIGLSWLGSGSPKHFKLLSDQDRLFSTEIIDVAKDKYFAIDNILVLSGSSLGDGITNSKLTSVGTLTQLSVAGTTLLQGEVTAKNIKGSSITLGESSQNTVISERGLTSSLSLDLVVGTQNVFYADSNNITIGSQDNRRRVIRANGTLAINVNNPDQDLSLAVDGNIGFAGRKFITGSAAPLGGNYSKGDICWNNEPQVGGHVGWVCIDSGAPGMWARFGMIG